MNDSDLLLRDTLDRLVPRREERVEWEDVLLRAASAGDATVTAPTAYAPAGMRSVGRRRALLLALAAAAIVVAIAAWPADRGAGNVLERATAALALEPGTILHVRADGHNIYTPWMEIWQTTDGPTTIRSRLGGSNAAGPCTLEFTYDARAQTMATWDAETQTIYWHRVEARSQKEMSFPDPLREIRAHLAAGDLREVGRGTISGREVIRLEPTQGPAEGRAGRVGDAVFAYEVDARTYAPVRWWVSTTQWYDYTTYEYLPDNAHTRQLLNLEAQHPGAARVEGSPADLSKSCAFG